MGGEVRVGGEKLGGEHGLSLVFHVRLEQLGFWKINSESWTPNFKI